MRAWLAAMRGGDAGYRISADTALQRVRGNCDVGAARLAAGARQRCLRLGETGRTPLDRGRNAIDGDSLRLAFRDDSASMRSQAF